MMVAERVQVQSRKVIDISQEPLSFRYICSVRAHPLSQTLWLGEGAASPLASHNRVSGPTLETPPRRQREIVVGICRPKDMAPYRSVVACAINATDRTARRRMDRWTLECQSPPRRRNLSNEMDNLQGHGFKPELSCTSTREQGCVGRVATSLTVFKSYS
jgi:hypothetical protein